MIEKRQSARREPGIAVDHATARESRKIVNDSRAVPAARPALPCPYFRTPHEALLPMTESTPLDVASLSHPGMVRAHNEDTVFVDGEAGHRRARRWHGRLQRRRGGERHRRQCRVQRPDAGAAFRPRTVEDRRAERPDARRAVAAADDRVGQQGHLRGRAGSPRVRGHGHHHRRRGVLRQPGFHRSHRRLALLPAARREVRAADARPFALAGADRQRRAHRPSRRAIRSTRTSSPVRWASRPSCPPTSPSTGSRPTISTCCAPTA